jgi:hypothetical protein
MKHLRDPVLIAPMHNFHVLIVDRGCLAGMRGRRIDSVVLFTLTADCGLWIVKGILICVGDFRPFSIPQVEYMTCTPSQSPPISMETTRTVGVG